MSIDAQAPPADSPSVDVARLHEAHPRVRAEDWRSPLILRLLNGRKYADGETSIAESFRAEDLQERPGTLPLRWASLGEDCQRCGNTYQEPVLTEFATLGLACVLLTRHTDLRLSEVTRRGERVDYWIGDATARKRFVIEIGGQQTGSIDALFLTKETQLGDNPWGQSGFVCVAVYSGGAARLWFCHQPEPA